VGTAAQAIAAGVGTLPVAFIGRTSTTTMQDPVESLHKQLRLSRERLPEGFVITRSYWDVESGGTDLDLRSRTDVWEKFTGAGIPRDGGMAELRAAIKAGKAPFTAVICENIERTGRDFPDALRLERELNAAGVLILATDEPIDAAAVRLVRRVEQGIAEYFRYNLKTQMWEGLKEYAISGHNTGRCPYGYAEDRTPHPNPMKASMGATRARLIIDPERGHWVTKMFEWRTDEKLSLLSIARRLIEQGAPAPVPGTPWSPTAVRAILANPKYTGRIVIGRTRNTAASPGERKMRKVPSAASTPRSATTSPATPAPTGRSAPASAATSASAACASSPPAAATARPTSTGSAPTTPPTPATPPRTPAMSAPPSPTTT
jgi:site-specific DNA recombinase